MKTISIVRHAKAEKPELYPGDFERPLTTRGHKDAERMATLLARLEPAVDLLLSSPAARAAQTADRFAAILGYANAVTWEEGIYLASAETLLALLRNAPDEATHLLLIGHNPGLEEVVAGLCAGAADSGVLTLPTAALAQLEVDITRWGQLRWGIGRLRLLVTAKAVREVK